MQLEKEIFLEILLIDRIAAKEKISQENKLRGRLLGVNLFSWHDKVNLNLTFDDTYLHMKFLAK